MGEEKAKIYFDNGSTSWPKAPGVAEAVGRLLTEGAFNINRGNYEGRCSTGRPRLWSRPAGESTA